jgi:hypothetical protein
MKCSTKPRGVPGKVDRNRAMAADRAAGVQLPVIAAVAADRTGGTESTVRHAEAKRIPVHLV